MGLGEDGLAEDIEAARSCIDEGCEVDAVQDILTRLEERRAVLQLEVTQIKDVMETLAYVLARLFPLRHARRGCLGIPSICLPCARFGSLLIWKRPPVPFYCSIASYVVAFT